MNRNDSKYHENHWFSDFSGKQENAGLFSASLRVESFECLLWEIALKWKLASESMGFSYSQGSNWTKAKSDFPSGNLFRSIGWKITRCAPTSRKGASGSISDRYSRKLPSLLKVARKCWCPNIPHFLVRPNRLLLAQEDTAKCSK